MSTLQPTGATTSADKKIWIGILALSVVVFGLVAYLNTLSPAKTLPDWATRLPLLNATLNGTCSILLVLSLAAIRRGKVGIHKLCNITAFVLSAVFLLSYVTYHAFGVETKFPEDNPLRPVYLVILTSHIVLAGGVLPFILMTFFRGLKRQDAKHRKLARWTWPLWFYVTVTGVLVYIFISPYYPF
ncbi:MAG: DUF420 domain-containing protein [Flavobacteriales bacterium]|nr:DUF420 domain-containing protein [Flavobacteriales bacterium]MCB9449225.1 DUF420 domain-containing protein [Flavobacteriales bacterium]